MGSAVACTLASVDERTKPNQARAGNQYLNLGVASQWLGGFPPQPGGASLANGRGSSGASGA